MKRIHKNKKAYTLVELLATVGILAIVAAVGIITFVSVRKNIKLKAYDSTAKEIYLAAQNQMLQLKAYGQWDALVDNHKTPLNEPDPAFFGEKLTEKPSDFEYWHPVVNSDAKTWDDIKNNMRVINVNASDAELSEFVEKILPLGSIEDGVRTNGTYIIEYNLKTAEIYSVFYTESKGQLYNTNSAFQAAFYGTGQGRPTDDASNSKSIRRDFNNGSNKFIIGYFGGGMLADAVEFDEMQIPEVILKNGEELLLHIKDINSNNTEREKSSVKITVTGKVSGNAVTYNIIQPNMTNDSRDDLGYCLQKENSLVNDNIAYLVKSCVESPSGITYEIVLDSLTQDIQIPGKNEYQNAHFASNFEGFYPGEDIEVTVTVGARGEPTNDKILVAVPVARRVESNSLFASSEVKPGGFVSYAEVQQLRHFENISSAISGAKLTADCTVEFTRAISFDNCSSSLDEILPIVPKDYTDKTITYLDGNAYVKGSFVPVNITNSITVNGNRHNIYNLRILSPNSNVSGMGLFGTIGGAYDADGNEIESSSISNLGIVSSDYVTDTSSESCEVETVYNDVDGKASAIGAFVGETNGTLTLQGCWSTVQIKQTKTTGANVGGLVGINNASLEINGCYVSGKTENGKYYTRTSGAETIDANIFVNAKDTVVGRAVNEGGFVGRAHGSVSIEDSYITTNIGMSSLNTEGEYNVGGFVGKVDTEISIDNSYFAGYLNLPLEYYVNDKAELNYSGFFGKKEVSATTSVDASDSFWIDEFLVLTGIDMYVNGDYGKSIGDSNIFSDTTTTAYPYDKTHKGVEYPFKNDTGLSHHWGDWADANTGIPDITILIVPDIGIEKIKDIDTQNGEDPPNSTNNWMQTKDGLGYFRTVPQGSGLKLDLEGLVKVTYLTGFKGLVFTDLDENEIDTSILLEADKRSATIYTSAAALEPINLTFDDYEDRNISIAQVYNKEDIVLNMKNIQNYDRCVNVCYFFSVTDPAVTGTEEPDYRNLAMMDGSFENVVSIIRADVIDKLENKPLNNNSEYKYLVKKDEHYGKLNYGVKAFAYYADLDEDERLQDYAEYIVENNGVISLAVPDDVKLPRIVFSEIPAAPEQNKDELRFDIDLFRCMITFKYDTSQIEGFYMIEGQKEDKSYFVEYGSDTLYVVPGGTEISTETDETTGKENIIITPVRNMYADRVLCGNEDSIETYSSAPPIPETDVTNIADFSDWRNGSNVYYLYNEDDNTLSLQLVTTVSNIPHTTNSNASEVPTIVWAINERTLVLTPSLEYIEVSRDINPNGGYFG